MLYLIRVIEDDLARAEEEFSSALSDVAEALPQSSAGQRLRAYVLGNAVADVYEGLEVILRHVAADFDEAVPRGEDWHRALLLQMAGPSESRPAVITADSLKALNILRGFRPRRPPSLPGRPRRGVGRSQRGTHAASPAARSAGP